MLTGSYDYVDRIVLNAYYPHMTTITLVIAADAFIIGEAVAHTFASGHLLVIGYVAVLLAGATWLARVSCRVCLSGSTPGRFRSSQSLRWGSPHSQSRRSWRSPAPGRCWCRLARRWRCGRPRGDYAPLSPPPGHGAAATRPLATPVPATRR